MNADDLRKLGAKTATEAFKLHLLEQFPTVNWHKPICLHEVVMTKAGSSGYFAAEGPRTMAEYDISARISMHGSLDIDGTVSSADVVEWLARATEAVPGIEWRVHLSCDVSTKEPLKTRITLSAGAAISNSDAPKGKVTELRKKRENEQRSMDYWKSEQHARALGLSRLDGEDADLQQEAMALGLKELAKRHHPDVGGSTEQMVRINRLREQIKR